MTYFVGLGHPHKSLYLPHHILLNNHLELIVYFPSSMKQQVLVPHAASTLRNIWLCMVIFFIKESFCSNRLYEACIPRSCGDSTSISFPFYIRGLQDPNCGYPGFELQCDNNNNNGSTITLQISGNDYIVKDIDYNNLSMRLIINTKNTTCLSKFSNLTLDPNQFVIDNVSTRELVFLTNCSRSQLPENLTRYRSGSCVIPEASDQLVMLRNDTHLGIGRERCRDVVVAPVEMLQYGNYAVVDGGNYAEVLERGFTLSWRSQVDCHFCKHTGGRCGSNMTDSYQFRCFCPDRPHKRRCVIEEKRKPVAFVTALTAGIGTILVVLILCIIRKLKQRKRTKNHPNAENFIKNHQFLDPKRYSYSQVKKMTNSFKVKLGQGGFGSVYKGALTNGSLVAVKVLSALKGNGEDFINEVATVGRTSHVNIVKLVGFCLEGHQRALIYEFMPNGSLEKFIYSMVSPCNSQLGWEKLNQIVVGIARGLEYLHSGCNTRILHFDIKPHNILLDKDLCPKISDFGLAKLFPNERSKISMSHMRGTPGYIAPELFSRNFGQVSNKSDVYSYGMMILEMFAGRKNIEVEVDHSSEMYFPQWIYNRIELNEEQLGLQGIVSDEENNMVKKTIIVGLWCIQTNPLNRPTITRVLEMLEGDIELLEIPPKPYMSYPSRPVSPCSPSTSFLSTK